MHYHLKLIKRYLNELPQLGGRILEAYQHYKKLGENYPAIWITPRDAPNREIISGGRLLHPTLNFSIYIYVKRAGEDIMEELYELENLITQKLYNKRRTECEIDFLQLMYTDYGSPMSHYGEFSTITPPFGVLRMDWSLQFVENVIN